MESAGGNQPVRLARIRGGAVVRCGTGGGRRRRGGAVRDNRGVVLGQPLSRGEPAAVDPDAGGAGTASAGPVAGGQTDGGDQGEGARAQAILPTSHGFRHLAEWAEREDADLILIPVSLLNPGLFKRLRGYSLRTLLDTRRGRCWWFIPTGQPGGPTLSIHRRNRNEWPPRWQHRAAVAPNPGRRDAYQRLPATPSPSPGEGVFLCGLFPCQVPFL